MMQKIDKEFINELFLVCPETGKKLMIVDIKHTDESTFLSMADSTGKVLWKHTITTEEA